MPVRVAEADRSAIAITRDDEEPAGAGSAEQP